MSIRSIFFWAHLSTGVLAGLVILMMSVTGTLLTYERQMVAAAEADLIAPVEGEPLELDELLAIASGIDASARVRMAADDSAPVRVFVGRTMHLVHPTTGDVMRDVETGTERFFSVVTRIHRWFALTGDNRATGKAITGAANLMFIFLALSGAYLWLPPVLRWSATKSRLWFRRQYATGHARDYNWHHVFSVWMLIPILVMATTATVFNYRWANELVYAAYGEEPPQRGRRTRTTVPNEPAPPAAEATTISLQARFERVTAAYPGWQTVTVAAGAQRPLATAFEVDMGNGAQYHRRYNVTAQPDGVLTDRARPFDARTPGNQARVTIRFLHTGEVLGFWGQTLAGLGSLAGVFLVWTGLALSYRRLIRPLFRNKATNDAAPEAGTVG